MTPRLKLENISKSFPGVKALDNITLELQKGEVHALCGENGAGKSTLMNILSGNIQADEGTMVLDGETVSFSNPQEAFNKGISIVHQHLSLCDNLSVAENIFTNQHPVNAFGLINYHQLYKQTSSILAELKIKLHPTTLISSLSPAQKQMVEIAKALVKKPQVLILDEPTASLTDSEIKILFEIIDALRKQNVSILYISHRLAEIFQLADRVSVLKDGKYQGTFTQNEITKEQLIKRMVGRDLSVHSPSPHINGEVLLEVVNLSGKKFTDINFKLYKGEIVGLAGLVGAGRTEIARVLFGVDEKIAGTITLNEKPVAFQHPADAIAHGIAYIPEDRKLLGLFLEMSIQENIVAAESNRSDRWLIDQLNFKTLAEEGITKLNVKAAGINQKVIQLSGGNQQKVLLAKWLCTKPQVLIVDEPTHGVDVGAKQEIYSILKNLAAEGIGIIMISSELPELLGLCNRILVIREGSVSGEVSSDLATEENILALATTD